jgi:toxin ParE1/3/4
MRDLIWQPEARKQLGNIIDYIAERSYVAAEKLNSRILKQIELCCAHPYIGRNGRLAGSRELVVHPNYIVVYRVHDTEVEIIRVLHSRQQYP